MEKLLSLVTGWKGYAAAAGAGVVLGGFLVWKLWWWSEAVEGLRAAEEANRSLQETVAAMHAEALANEQALAAAIARAQSNAAEIAALEEQLSHVDPSQDCLPDPALQPLTDGLR